MNNIYTSKPTKTETMTAREMALTPHSLSRDSMTAKTTDGKKFGWCNGQWVRFA